MLKQTLWYTAYHFKSMLFIKLLSLGGMSINNQLFNEFILVIGFDYTHKYRIDFFVCTLFHMSLEYIEDHYAHK